MSILLGPVGHAGHPFNDQTDFPQRRYLWGEEVYTFGTLWGDSEIEFIPATPLTHLVIWDPAWLHGEPALEKLYRYAQEHELRVVGVYSDWFAGWHGETCKRVGTKRSLDICHRIIIDSYGEAALRRWGYPGEIRVLDQYLSYGRLPVRGGDHQAVLRTAETHPQEDRPTDVCFIGHDHAGYIWNRAYMLDQLQAACDAYGWTSVIGKGYTAAQLEDHLTQAKVCFNCQLGSQPNMRAYEAAACGAVLVTNPPLIPGAFRYQTIGHAVTLIRRLVHDAELRRAAAAEQSVWAVEHTPLLVWQRILELACD